MCLCQIENLAYKSHLFEKRLDNTACDVLIHFREPIQSHLFGKWFTLVMFCFWFTLKEMPHVSHSFGNWTTLVVLCVFDSLRRTIS